MKFSLDTLNKYIEDGLVIKQSHPTLPLSIYNYSRTCQFDKAWDEITLNCRGLILDDKGNVVARPFSKFFNMEEIPENHIPKESFEVFEKMDGSLGIIFNYNLEWIFATRGSFTSDQAIKAKEIFYNHHDDLLLSRSNTYLFEIIYPENRIVVDYGNEEKLVMLAEIHTESGEELDVTFNTELGFNVVKKYDGINNFKTLKQMVGDNSEGFIVRFKNGFRMKIKGEEYVRLHRILTNFSSKDIWECLKKGDDLSKILDNVPDEFDVWVKNTIRDLKHAYYQINEYARKKYDYFMYGKYNDKEPITDKKIFAQWVLKQEGYIQPILFKMFDKKDYSNIIWDMIKPKYEKPFWNKETTI